MAAAGPHQECPRRDEEDATMPMTRMPSLAMLLVLANIALCLSAAAQKDTPVLRRPTNVALSAAPLGAEMRINVRRPASGLPLARTPARSD
jgi:hypothetical protein